MPIKDQVYQTVLPQLEILEEERKAAIYKAQNYRFAILGILLLFGGIGFYLYQDIGEKLFEYWWAIIPLLLICFFLEYRGSSKKDQVRYKFKHEILPTLIKAIDPNLQYEPFLHIHSHQFRRGQLFQSPDRFNGEDYVKGKIGKTDFEFSEVHAIEVTESTDSDGNTTTSESTIFKGLYMIADFHKHFHGRTYVMPKSWGWFTRKKTWRGEKIITESPRFEDTFNVYASDQVEARYILSTRMLEDILALKDKFKCDVYLSFVDSSVHIAIRWNINILEPNLKKDLRTQTIINKFYEELMICFDLIEDLNLNTRIWSKE